MSTEGAIADVATSSAIRAACRKTLYRDFVETNQAINAMKFDDFEANVS